MVTVSYPYTYTSDLVSTRVTRTLLASDTGRFVTRTVEKCEALARNARIARKAT